MHPLQHPSDVGCEGDVGNHCCCLPCCVASARALPWTNPSLKGRRAARKAVSPDLKTFSDREYTLGLWEALPGFNYQCVKNVHHFSCLNLCSFGFVHLGLCGQMEGQDRGHAHQPGFAHHAHPWWQRHLMGIVFAKLRGFLAPVHWLPTLYSHENVADSRVPHVEERLDLPSPGACLSPSRTARAEAGFLALPAPFQMVKDR